MDKIKTVPPEELQKGAGAPIIHDKPSPPKAPQKTIIIQKDGKK